MHGTITLKDSNNKALVRRVLVNHGGSLKHDGNGTIFFLSFNEIIWVVEALVLADAAFTLEVS